MSPADDAQTDFIKLRSPLCATLGMEYTELSKDRVRAELTVSKEICTIPDVMHGGAVMAVADDMGAMGTILNMPEGTVTSTIESKTNFLAGIAIGQKLLAECTPVHVGRTTQVWQTRLSREDGRLAAVVTQTQIVLPKK